ncbi:MAG: hypothetical protein JOY93_04180 [Acidobacteriales bacterium]|nr:hypothetical protein [Terriglobales bacterium]
MAFHTDALPPQPFALRAVPPPGPKSALPASLGTAAARRFTLLRIYCQATSVFSLWLAALVLSGWALHNETLTSVFPGLVAMKPNTALGLACAGISLWLFLPGESHAFRGQIARFLGFAVALIGAAVLTEYLFHLNLGIDELFFTEPRGTVGTYSPGRLSPLTAAAFVAIGSALSLLDSKTQRGRRPAQGLTLLSATISMMAINGYIFHALAPDRILLGTQVALHTGIAIFLLSIAILFARPGEGIAAYLTGEGSGSVMARRLLPAVFGVPIVLGWFRMQGQLAGLYGTELGLTLFCTSTIVCFATLVWLTARRMNQEYEDRRRTEQVSRAPGRGGRIVGRCHYQ